MKNILVITYSQSGQLTSIVENILKPLKGDIRIHREYLKPIPDYSFPWKGISFYDAMPECVEMIPSQLHPLTFDQSISYDLIILGYPIWFLSPPIPITTFLKSKEAKIIMNGKPVVTVIGSRNMWISAQESIKEMIIKNGGILRGNISLHDRHNNLASVVTIIHWMVSGKKDRYLGIFPKPGISDKDIEEAEKFGHPILKSIINDDFENLQNHLLELNSVEIERSVLSTEKKGKKIFKIWSKFILKKGESGNPSRITRLKMFKYYLLFVIFVVSPVVTLFYYLTYPLFFMKINKELKYYRGVNPKN